jgi:hypothetical protein
MGLVDKILESFKTWANIDVEDFNNEDTEAIRSEYRTAMEEHKITIENHQAALTEMSNAVNTPAFAQAKALEATADKARTKAKRKEAAAKKDYDEAMQYHNAKKSSLCQRFEIIYRRNGIKREHYHGGKFNEVNCIRIMERSEQLILGEDGLPGFLQACLETKHPTILTNDAVEKTCGKFARLLGLLDAIWSSVRGLPAGLLPTQEQYITLQTALLEAKELWLEMKLSTLQPKWHLTFDGHLLEQYRKYEGLADKSDESIEKEHQTLKTLRDQFRGISCYEQRETCIRRELRRFRSPEIRQHVDQFNESIKQSTGTKRAIQAAERLDGNKKAKQEKRRGYIAS